MFARYMPDGSIVFPSQDVLEKWATEWCLSRGYQPPKQPDAVAEATTTYAAPPPLVLVAREGGPSRKAGKRRTPQKTLTQRARTMTERAKSPSPQWTPELVSDFLRTIGTRSRTLATAAVQLEGGNGMSAKEFADKISSNVTGLGKRFKKLETDSQSFSPSLPVPVRLVGPAGERALAVDPQYAAALVRLWEIED